MVRDIVPGTGESDILFELTPDLVCVTNFDGYFVRLNRRWQEVLGYTLQELMSKPALSFVHPDDVERTLQSRSKLASGQDVMFFENRYMTREGQAVWLEWSVRARLEEKQMYGVARVVTERKRSHDEFKRLAMAIEASDDAIAWTDLEDKVRAWNSGAERMFGYPAGEIIDQSSALLTVNVEEARLLLSRVHKGESVTQFETTLRRKNGEVLPVSLTSSPVRDEGGRIIGVSWVARDITRRKQLEQQIAHTGRLASVGTLASGVAHEINNPLSYVLNNVVFVGEELTRVAAMLAASNAPEVRSASGIVHEANKVLAEALHGAERIQRIVRDLKTFARSDDRMDYPLRVHDVLESAVTIAWSEVRHHARLLKDYGDVPLLYGNPAQLAQVIINLLVNAAQSIPAGQADQNEIRLSTRLDTSGKVLIEVKDTGSGIAPDVRERIFDPFFTTKAVGEGTGLGLSICHGIVKAMGGSITVESDLGQGSTFRVWLPIAGGVETKAPQVQPAATVGARVLILDDERMVGTSLARVLPRAYDVHVMTSAHEALLNIEKGGRYDAIICDVMMPDLSGAQFYEILLDVAPKQAERLVFITGGTNAPQVGDVERYGRPILDKPCGAQDLLDAIALASGVGPKRQAF